MASDWVSSTREFAERMNDILAEPVPDSVDVLIRYLEALPVPEQTFLLEHWLLTKQCQVSRLVETLLENRHLQAVAAQTLQLFSRSPLLAHECANSFPEQLHELVSDVVFSDSFQQVGRGNRSSLLRAIGQDPNLTSAFENGLSQKHCTRDAIVETLAKALGNETLDNTDEGWLVEIESAILTIPLSTLGLVPEHVLLAAYRHWTSMMGSKSHFCAITALHIASHLHEQHKPECDQGNSRLALPEPLVRWMEKASSAFLTVKATSTIKSIVLRIIWALSQQSSDQNDECIAVISKGVRILRGCNESVVKSWRVENTYSVQKLIQKTHQTWITPLMRMDVLEVLFILDPQFGCEHHTAITLEDLLTDMLQPSHHFYPQESANSEAHVYRTISLLQQVFKHDPLRLQSLLDSLMTQILELCQPGKHCQGQLAGPVDWAILLLRALQDEMLCSFPLPNHLAEVFTKLKIPEWWPLNLATPGQPENCLDSVTCLHNAESKRQQLCLEASLISMEALALTESTVSIHKIRLLSDQVVGATPARIWNSCEYSRKHSVNTDEESECVSLCRSVQTGLTTVGQVLANSTAALVEGGCAEWKKLQELHYSTKDSLLSVKETGVLLESAIYKMRSKLSTARNDHQALSTAVSIKEESEAFQALRAANLEAALNELQEKHAALQSDHCKILGDFNQMKINSEHHIEVLSRRAEEEAQDIEVAHKGVVLALQDEICVEQAKTRQLESEVEWLKEQMEASTREIQAAHDAAVARILAEKSNVLDMTEQKAEEMETALEMSKSEVQDLTRTQKAYECQIAKQGSQIDELKAAIRKLEEDATLAVRQLSEARQVEQSLLDILQRAKGMTVLPDA